jgi:hypothetical protein
MFLIWNIADSQNRRYIKFIRHNFKDSHPLHVGNYQRTKHSHNCLTMFSSKWNFRRPAPMVPQIPPSNIFPEPVILFREECGLLGYNTMQFRERPTFWRSISLPSSGKKSKPRKKPAEAGGKLSSVWLTACFCWFLSWFTLRSWI